MSRASMLKSKWPQIVLGLLLFGLGYVTYTLAYRDGMRLHRSDGFCPRGTWAQQREGVTVPGRTVVLIDTSDRITPQDAAQAFDRIGNLVRDTARIPFLQRISIVGLPESAVEISRENGQSWCVPKQGATANPWYENRRVVELEFRKFLRQGVKTKLDSLRNREQADQSPILETMSHLAQEHEDLDSFVLVSDMLQHTELASHYDGDMTLGPEARTECNKLLGGDRLRSVWVYYVDRELEVQGNLWPTPWWAECLQGVQAQTLR